MNFLGYFSNSKGLINEILLAFKFSFQNSYFTELERLGQLGHSLNVAASGTVILMLESGYLKRKCKFYDVLYVPELTYNLLSVLSLML